MNARAAPCSPAAAAGGAARGRPCAPPGPRPLPPSSTRRRCGPPRHAAPAQPGSAGGAIERARGYRARQHTGTRASCRAGQSRHQAAPYLHALLLVALQQLKSPELQALLGARALEGQLKVAPAAERDVV